MHPLANHLIQLQELALIREEQRVATKGGHLERLDVSIGDMRKQLPQELRIQFEKLHKKDPIVIAPIADKGCSVCRMSLPISLVQAVRLGREIHGCPNCARMLYYPESHPRRTGERTRRTAPRKVGISRFSSHTLMIPRLEATDKEAAIEELAHKMGDEGFVDRPDWLVEEALRREAIVTTALEHGLAVPHVRHVEGGGLALALGISRKGLDWGGSGKALTRIIFFMAIPTAASAFYLKLVAGLAESFLKPDARKALMAEKDPEKLWKVLVRATRSTIK